RFSRLGRSGIRDVNATVFLWNPERTFIHSLGGLPTSSSARTCASARIDRGFEARAGLTPFHTCPIHEEERTAIALPGLEHREVLLQTRIGRRIRETLLIPAAIHSALDGHLFTSGFREILCVEEGVHVVLQKWPRDPLDADRGARSGPRIR